jgi:integrase
MGSVYKRGGNWYIDIRIKRRRVRRKVGTSKKLAELALKDAEVKAARHEFGFTNNDIAIDKFFNRFLEYSRVSHQPATTARYCVVLDHFKAFITSYPQVTVLSEISADLVDRYKVFRKEGRMNADSQVVESQTEGTEHPEKRGARAHTVNFEIRTLKLVFNLAIKWGYLKENPTKEVAKLKVNDSKAPRFLTVDECKRLLEACSPELYPIYFTFLNTGMRKAELENLGWDDVDLERRKISIRHKESWQPKTGEREIPINDALYELLQNLKQHNAATLVSKYVFCARDGGKLKTKLREKLIKIGQRARIESLTRLHTHRHTFASHLVMQGVDLPTVQKLMGHADIQTTMIYAHLAPDHLADAVNKLTF